MYDGPPWQGTSNAKAAQDQPRPKGVTEDLATDKSLIARDENRMLFAEKVSAGVWRERMNRESLATAEQWNLRPARIVKKEAGLAKAVEEAGITPIACEGYYVLGSDFFERGLALELAMALRKRIESLEQSP